MGPIFNIPKITTVGGSRRLIYLTAEGAQGGTGETISNGKGLYGAQCQIYSSQWKGKMKISSKYIIILLGRNLYTKMVNLGHQVSELQAENEQLGKENGELKLVALHSSPSLKGYQGDQHRQNPQVSELQDKVWPIGMLYRFITPLLELLVNSNNVPVINGMIYRYSSYEVMSS